MNEAELIEQMASEAGLKPSEVRKTLDAFTEATTRALQKGDSVVLIGFGSFSISKRSARTGRNPSSDDGPGDDSVVAFDSCPEFAAALDLNPGKGDEASARCRDADVEIDADYIADETGRDPDGGVSKADAKRALDAFTSVATKALKKGDRLSLGEPFGEFTVSTLSARGGRTRRSGKEIQIAAKNVVEFKAGAELSKAVD
jgi:nucleoid DNA-binding protein